MTQEKELTTQADVEARGRANDAAKKAAWQSIGGMCDAAGVSLAVVSSDINKAPASVAAILRENALSQQRTGQSRGM